MTRPIWAEGLLATADKLAGRGAGAGRPALTNLRLATSTACYALFHQISRHGVFASLPTATEDDVAHVARWFTHTGVRGAADLVLVAEGGQSAKKGDTSPVALLRGAAPLAPQLLLVAESFAELQDRRVEADYSNDYDPVRLVTLDHMDTARAAVNASWSLWTAGNSPRTERALAHDGYRRFLQLALFKSGGPRSR